MTQKYGWVAKFPFYNWAETTVNTNNWIQCMVLVFSWMWYISHSIYIQQTCQNNELQHCPWYCHLLTMLSSKSLYHAYWPWWCTSVSYIILFIQVSTLISANISLWEKADSFCHTHLTLSTMPLPRTFKQAFDQCTANLVYPVTCSVVHCTSFKNPSIKGHCTNGKDRILLGVSSSSLLTVKPKIEFTFCFIATLLSMT